MNFSNHPYLCKGLYKAKNYLARRPLFKIKEHTIILKIGMTPQQTRHQISSTVLSYQ
ncbi:hypothetical protein THERMOS_2138 [Bathymodiolus thermophilus thioautotrophic gill symbiont]|uniref:Uncharacterized protein n=1 Tax=Bathymodiolus thermophilus thioautotrophic gill symbiont TaxID=2360 RepID=A0A8H8XEK3_9GAMM|nr:hypothetical protein THERMOS_2138 [Bathymodiolus thermophilus thioautotrophic gill symbiont]